MAPRHAPWLIPFAALAGWLVSHGDPVGWDEFGEFHRVRSVTEPPVEQVAPGEAASHSAAVAPSRARLIARLGADRWHADGVRGQGVKVAVIDSGFRGWRDHLGLALPARGLGRAFRDDRSFETRDSAHGILCGEVVHAIAPDAELVFANWETDKPETFVQAVAWAKQQGARVLTCSVIMPSWSDGEGGGPVHAALARVTGDGSHRDDLACFACAGNIAQRHWAGQFTPDRDGYHLWRDDKRDNALMPWGEDERVSVELCWPGTAAYTLHVLDAVTGSEIGRAPPAPVPNGHCAVVRFVPKKGGQYLVRVRYASGTPGPFHVAALGGWLERFTEKGSIAFPADGTEFAAVGAVEEDGRRASYSSCGPNSRRPKPDYVATVPFQSVTRSKPFAGTSAAAPQAAALAALILSKHPEWTPAQVRAALERSAVDIAPTGFDPETGFGVLRLPAE